MVASQAKVEQSPDTVVLELTQVMESCAESGEWEKVEEIATHLRSAVMQIPERRRRDALLSAQRSIGLVESLAKGERGVVKDQLSALRRGEDARKAYELID